MASQSWRQYGSINKNESSNSGYFHNLVVDNFTLKDHYNGFLNVNGTLSVTDGVIFNSTLSVSSDVNLNHNLTVVGSTLLNKQLTVVDMATFQNKVNILGDLNVIGSFQFQNDIRSVGNLAAGGTSLILGSNKTSGTSSLNSNDVISGLIGLNTPVDLYKTFPGSGLDVYNGAFITNTALNVFNGVSTIGQSVLVSILSNQNENTIGQVNYTPSSNEFFNTSRNGIIAYTDTSSCSINFFTSQSQSIQTTTNPDGSNNYITINTITPTAGDLAITYTSLDKTLTINGQQTTVIPSSIIIGAPYNPTIFNETLSLFTNTTSSSATQLLPNNYNVPTNVYSIWNTMTMASPKVTSYIPYACTFMNMIDYKTNYGLKMGGGTYINDTTRSVGILGVTTDSNTNWAPSQMIVSGSNPAYCHTTTGFNTFAPHTEKYSLDINGSVKITNGEIVLIKEKQPYEIANIISCYTNRSIIMALSNTGKPINIANNSNPVYPIKNLFSKDGGIHWSLSNTYYSDIITTTKDGYIYDISYSILSYNNSIITSINGCLDWGGLNFADAYYKDDGTLLQQSVTKSRSCNCSSIRIFKFDDPGVLIVFAGTDTTSGIIPNKQYVYFSYLQKISNISNYIGSTQYLFLTKFPIEISLVNTIDGYDTSYLFVAGSTGIYKYNINTSFCDDVTKGGRIDGCNLWVPYKKEEVLSSSNYLIKPNFAPAQTISNTASIIYNVGKATYNKMQTYKSYDSSGNLLPDTYFSVFVGNGIITSTLDGGKTFQDVSFTDISFNSVYIHDSRQAIATATGGIIYTTYNGGFTWSSALNEFNHSGDASCSLMNPTSNLTSVCMSSSNDLIISRLDVSYNSTLTNTPSSNLYFCHLPCLFNRQYSSILDICGSMYTYGYSYVEKNLTVGNNTVIGGSITVNSGSVQIKQGSYDPSGTAGIGATMVINGGVGITGNVIIGNNLTVNNTTYLSSISSTTPNGNLTISSGNGNINIGSYSTVFTNSTNNINIGTTLDNIILSGTITSNGALTTSADKISVYMNTSLQNIQKNAGLTIGGNMDKTNAYNGYMMTDTNNLGILLKAPNSNNSVDILLDSMMLNSNITRGILTLESLQNYKNIYGYSQLSQYDPSYIVSSCSNIDISNLILSTNINSINNVQTIQTSVSINGNLSVSTGNIKINQISTSSSDTGTGAIVVSGGVGVSGNINTGGYVKLLNTDPYNALSVSGGVYLGGNLRTSGDISGANLNINNNITVNGNSFVSGQSFINVVNSVNGSYSYRTLLSMTDFSYNVTFYSTTDAYSSTLGAITVMGGAGISGNVFVGGNTVIVSNTPSNGTKSGALQVVGGAGISGNVFVGGNTTILGKIPSNSTNSGSLQVVGGAGISGNVFVGGNTIILGNTNSNSTNSGALQVVGGAGISGNVFVGGTTIILGNTNSNGTNSGALQVVGGVGISKDLLIGGNITIGGLLNVTSTVPSVSCYTGVTMGGLGIQGNLYVNNQSYLGSNSALFSGLLLYYPFSTDILNYATGTPVTDMELYPPSNWAYNYLSNRYGYMVGGPGGNVLDISSITLSNTNISNYLSSTSTFSSSQIQNLTQFTISFWINVQLLPAGNRASLFSFNNNSNPSVGGGPGSTNSILYADIDYAGIIHVDGALPTGGRGIIGNSPGYSYSNKKLATPTWNLLTFNCISNPDIGDGNQYNFGIKLYINGVLDASYIINQYISSPLTSFNRLHIGYDNLYNSVGVPCHYLLNDFRLYSRVLDVKEIIQLYNSTGLVSWSTNVCYNETMIMNSDTTTYTTTPSYNTVYTPISFPPNITTAISGNLAVSGFSNLRGNTLIMGDLNVTGYFLQNGTRLGYNVTDSSMIVAGTGGYFGGNLLVGKVFLNTLTLGSGGYFGGSTTSGDISLNRIKLGQGGYFGGSMTNGDISLNHINLGSGGYFGGNINSGDISLNHIVIGGSSVSTSTNTGNLQVIGGVGIGGNINVGGSTSTYSASTISTSPSTGALVVNSGVGIGGNINVGGATSTYSASTVSTSPSTGALVVNSGVGIGGNINVGGATSTYSASTVSTSPSTGALVVNSGVGIGGNINVGGATSTYTASTISTSPSTGALVVNNGVGIGGNINVGGATSTYTANTISTSPSTGALVVNNGVGIGGNINVGGTTSTYTANTASTSSGSGTLVVNGGVGIGGAINVGGVVNVGGATSTYSASTASTSPSVGALVVNGGVGIGGAINVGGTTNKYTANTESTSSGSGTIVVTGGVGIGGNVYVGKTINTINLNIGDTIGNNGVLTINKASKLAIKNTAFDSLNVDGGGIFDILKVNNTLNVSNAITGGSLTVGTGSITGGSLTVGSGSITGGTLIVSGAITGGSLTVGTGSITGGSLTVGTGSITGGSLTVGSGSITGGTLIVSGAITGGSLTVGTGSITGGSLTAGSCSLSGGVVTATSFNAQSDYRIKTSITELDPTFTIDSLRPVKYTNIHDSNEYIGFIAHEIQQTYPFLVTGEKDGEETQTMNYDGIIGILVNEIKMLKQRICVLENK